MAGIVEIADIAEDEPVIADVQRAGDAVRHGNPGLTDGQQNDCADHGEDTHGRRRWKQSTGTCPVKASQSHRPGAVGLAPQ